MQIIWLGHSSFRIEIEGAVLLIDPWLGGAAPMPANPMFPAGQRAAAIAGATPYPADPRPRRPRG